MSSIFYPVLPLYCPWGDLGSCTFCGIPFKERVLTPQMPSARDLRGQFDAFASNERNRRDIKRHGRVAIAPNGSVVPEVPKALRSYIMRFCSQHALVFESELIATLVNSEKARALYTKSFETRLRHIPVERLREREAKKIPEHVERVLAEIHHALNVEFPGRNVLLNTGVEVADSRDLRVLHKYTTDLADFTAFAEYLRARGIRVGANVLLGAPMIGDPIRKAFATTRFAFEKMRVDKVLLIAWNPDKRTVAKKLYDQGRQDVLSATECAAIYREVRSHYPEKNIEFNPIRVHIWHGRHQNFRALRIVTEEQKAAARERVRGIAEQVFAS